MTPVYEAMAKYATPAAVKNAKAKVIEPWFNHAMQTACMKELNWTGHNSNAKVKRQPNLGDITTAEKHSFPDEAGVLRQLEQKIAKLRSEKINEYMTQWATVPADKKLPMSRENYLYYFGNVRYRRGAATDATTELITNRFTGAGVIAAIAGKERTYDCFDLNFRRNTEVDWVLRYDPDDLKTVLATNTDGTLRFLLEEKYIQPMALAERQDGDSDNLQRVRNFNRKINEYITAVRNTTDSTVYDFMREHSAEMNELTAQHNDTLYKHILTDSRGQHKEHLQKQRVIDAGREMEISYTRKKELEMERSFVDERREFLKKKVDLSQYIEDTPPPAPSKGGEKRKREGLM